MCGASWSIAMKPASIAKAVRIHAKKVRAFANAMR